MYTTCQEPDIKIASFFHYLGILKKYERFFIFLSNLYSLFQIKNFIEINSVYEKNVQNIILSC